VVQCLGRRSLAGGLSLPDLCDHFVGKVSAVGQPIRSTQPSIPPGSVNEWQSMYVHGIWEWRPLSGRPGLPIAVWSQVKVYGRKLSIWPIGCTPAQSVTQSAAAAAVCGLWRYISVICLCFCLHVSHSIMMFVATLQTYVGVSSMSRSADAVGVWKFVGRLYAGRVHREPRSSGN